MMSFFAYPYPSYVPNPIIAGCVAGIVSISLIAWFIQSCHTRFQPRRLSVLLLISHLTICIDLIVRASVQDKQLDSRTIYSVLNSLFAIGQRMIIVSNFSFVLEIHHQKSCLSRTIFISAILCVVTSGCLMAPANIFSFDPNQINTSFLFRQLSAAVLLGVTIYFFLILAWSRTIKDMTKQGVIVIIVSSILCLIAAIVNLIQSLSEYYYNEMNSKEEWFYGMQMAPIILAHFTWSILHPKRSIGESRLLPLVTQEVIFINDRP